MVSLLCDWHSDCHWRVYMDVLSCVVTVEEFLLKFIVESLKTVIYMTWCQKVRIVGVGFWLPIKSVSNTLSCCCIVCAFIISQYQLSQWKQYEFQIWSCWSNIYFWKWKPSWNSTWKQTCSWWVLLIMYMTNQNITSVTDLHRGDIALHSAYKIGYPFKVLFLELVALDRTLLVFKCSMTSIHWHSSEDLTFSFTETLP